MQVEHDKREVQGTKIEGLRKAMSEVNSQNIHPDSGGKYVDDEDIYAVSRKYNMHIRIHTEEGIREFSGAWGPFNIYHKDAHFRPMYHMVEHLNFPHLLSKPLIQQPMQEENLDDLYHSLLRVKADGVVDYYDIDHLSDLEDEDLYTFSKYPPKSRKQIPTKVEISSPKIEISKMSIGKFINKFGDKTISNWSGIHHQHINKRDTNTIPSATIKDGRWHIVEKDGQYHCTIKTVNVVQPELGGPSVDGYWGADEDRPWKKLVCEPFMAVKTLCYVDIELYAHLKSKVMGRGISVDSHSMLTEAAQRFLKQYRVNCYDPLLLLEVVHFTVLAAMVTSATEIRALEEMTANRRTFEDIKRVATFRQQGTFSPTRSWYHKLLGLRKPQSLAIPRI